MKCIGIDGCKYGWIAVSLTKQDWDVKTFATINDLMEAKKDESILLIDMPMGLRANGNAERLNDKLAREMLRKRHSSIFPAPCRSTLGASTYQEASLINQQYTGKKISWQLWGIIPKIREVDEYVTKHQEERKKLFEAAPELCFQILNNNQALEFNKTTAEGFQERLGILRGIYPQTQEIVEYSSSKYLRRDVKKDDILDALCLGIHGLIGLEMGFVTIPAEPETDEMGIPMRIVFGNYAGNKIKQSGCL